MNFKKTFIIAEAGVNHNGRLDLALKLVDAAKAAGADAVKFQTFKTEAVITRKAGKAAYQRQTTGGGQTQFDMVRKLELSFEDFRRIAAHCAKKRIAFVSTPCDPQSVDLLKQLKVPFFKIGSAEVTNIPFLQHAARQRVPIVLSTGMSTLAEVKEAVSAIRRAGHKDLALLHCVTEYPAPAAQMNLAAMHTLHKAFKVPVGLSDHTLGVHIAVAAVALGARIIEKHLTLDKSMTGPDHKASLNPVEFRQMVTSIREVESALGDGKKRPAACELKNIDVVRRSVVAACAISKNTRITEQMIAFKRPGTGIAPKSWRQVIGRRAAKNIQEDDVLQWGHLVK